MNDKDAAFALWWCCIFFFYCEIRLFHTKEEREEGRVHGCLAQRRY